MEFEQVKKPKKVVDLLALLAYQIGKEVAVSELASGLGLSQKTVENYLDVGLRNALIRSFVPLSLRNDVGELFENWFVMERIKRAGNAGRFTGFYFWRTYDQHEIDLVEDVDGRLMGFECKWSPRARVKAPGDWLRGYPDAGFHVATRENWMEYLEEG